MSQREITGLNGIENSIMTAYTSNIEVPEVPNEMITSVTILSCNSQEHNYYTELHACDDLLLQHHSNPQLRMHLQLATSSPKLHLSALACVILCNRAYTAALLASTFCTVSLLQRQHPATSMLSFGSSLHANPQLPFWQQ